MKDGDKVTLIQQAGKERTLKGTVRIFTDDAGQKRYELVDVTEKRGEPYDDVRHYEAIGFDPDTVTLT